MLLYGVTSLQVHILVSDVESVPPCGQSLPKEVVCSYNNIGQTWTGDCLRSGIRIHLAHSVPELVHRHDKILGQCE